MTEHGLVETVDHRGDVWTSRPTREPLALAYAFSRVSRYVRINVYLYDAGEECIARWRWSDPWREARARVDRRRREVRAVMRGGERPIAFPGECNGPITLLVHRDTYPERVGRWRLTRIDAAGEPFGHTESESFESALVEAATHWGAKLSEGREP